MAINRNVFFLYLRSCLNLRKRRWCHRGRAALRPKTYINIKVLFPGLILLRMDLWTIMSVKVMASPPRIFQHWPSTPQHHSSNKMKGTFPCLTQTQPHKSSSWSFTYLTSERQFFQPYSLYSPLILMFCLYAVLLYLTLLCLYMSLLDFVFKKWREEQKQNASIIFEKHCDVSKRSQRAAG